MNRTKKQTVRPEDTRLTKVPRWMGQRVAAIAKLRGCSQASVWEAIAGKQVEAEFEAACAAARKES